MSKKVSVAMIVYNEEEMIKISLGQVIDWADQVIILNGSPEGPSTDKTTSIISEITKGKTNVIYKEGKWGSHRWEDNWDRIQRNEYLKYVIGDFLFQCVPEDEKILISGEITKRIKDISVNDEVLSHDGKYHKVKNVFKRNYNGELINVFVKQIHSPLRLTPEHPVLAIKTALCRKESWIKNNGRLKCLPWFKCRNGFFKRNTSVEKCIEIYKDYKAEWVSCKDLTVGDIILCPKKKIKEKPVQRFDMKDFIDPKRIIYDGEYCYLKKRPNMKLGKRFIEITPNLFKLFGYYLSEGYIDKKGNSTMFAFHSKETEFHNDVLSIVGSVFNKKTNIYKFSNSNCCTLVFSSILYSNLFKKLFGCGARNKTIPDWVLGLPLPFLSELINGYFKGDGHRAADVYNVCSASYNLITQMWYLLMKFDICARFVNKKDKSQTYVLSVGGTQLKKLEKTGLEHPFTEKRDSTFQCFYSDDSYFYLPVKKIEKEQYSGYVCNLEVEDSNSYVCNGLAVHNCDADEFYSFKDLEILSRVINAPENEKITGVFLNNVHYYGDRKHYLKDVGLIDQRFTKFISGAKYDDNSVILKTKEGRSVFSTGPNIRKNEITRHHFGHAVPWERYKPRIAKFIKRGEIGGTVEALEEMQDTRSLKDLNVLEYSGTYPELMQQEIDKNNPFFNTLREIQ